MRGRNVHVFEKEKNLLFQSGFDPKNNSQLPFFITIFFTQSFFFDVGIGLIPLIIKTTKIINNYEPSYTTNLII